MGKVKKQPSKSKNETVNANEGKAETNNKLKPFAEHLTLLGYDVTQTETESGNNILIANHTRKPQIVLMNDNNGISFRNYLDANKYALNNHGEYLEFVNSLNVLSLLIRFFIDDESSLVMHAWFTDEYNKETFGNILDMIIHDIQEVLAVNPETKKFFSVK